MAFSWMVCSCLFEGFCNLLLIHFTNVTMSWLCFKIYFSACRWDDDHHIVVDSHYGQMQSELPVMHMMPRQNFTRPADDYVAPLYKTSVRAGVLSTTGHSTNFVVSAHLPSKQNSDYWVCKGAALLTQLDA
jgi:dynein heavy chain